MRMNKPLLFFMMGMVLLMLSTSCVAKKMSLNSETRLKQDTLHMQVESEKSQTRSVRELTYARRVYDNQVYTENIVGGMSFRLEAGSKNISVPGALKLRKNKMIRIQLFIPILGSEVGRMDFTPDYVLIVDRIHKQYIKADYNQVDFLQKQGLNFYSLQALFWNQLLVPGNTKVSDSDLKRFSVSLDEKGELIPLTLKNGSMTYNWNTDKTSAKIQEAIITFKDTKYGTSTLNWKYSDFKNIGVKQFPASQIFEFVTHATRKEQKVKVTINMDELGTSSDWSLDTELSPKYKQVDVQEVLGQIMNM